MHKEQEAEIIRQVKMKAEAEAKQLLAEAEELRRKKIE